MGLVAVGDFTITDVNDGLNGRLSLNSYVVPTGSDGVGGDFSGASTTMSVMQGKTDDTSNWTITAITSVGVTGQLVGGNYTVTGMTGDTGFVDLTAKRTGYPDQTSRFSITKSKKGEAGPSVTVTASAAGFVFTDDKPTPAKQAISLTVHRQGNIKTPALFFASNGAELDQDVGLTALNALLSIPSDESGDTVWIDLEDLGTDQQMYVTTVVGEITHVTQIPRLNFYTAEAGATRNVFRGSWAAATAYSKGDQVISGGSGWAAKSAHVSSAANQPPEYPATENTFWAASAVKGDRGTVQTSAAIPGKLWTDAAAVQAISVATKGLTPMSGDVVTLYNSAEAFSQTRVFLTNGTWSPLAAFFGGDVLVDGTLVGTKLAAQTITGANIAGETIVGSNMVAGTLTSVQIAAKAIGVEKLVVTGAGNALNNDPNFEDAAFWPVAAGRSIISVADAYAGKNVLRFTNAHTLYFPDHKFPIDTAKTYLLEIAARGSGGRFYGVWQFWDAAGNAITSSTAHNWPSRNSTNYYHPSNEAMTTSWTRYTLQVGPDATAKFPPNAAFMSYGILSNYPATVFQQDIGSIRVTEMARGELIVDGAITARTMSSGEVITLSAQIKDAIISSAKIIDLDAAQVRAGTAIAGTITVNNTQLGIVKNNAELGAQDPATRINSAVTQIDPGKIRISAGATLSSWIRGGDETRIDGAMISTGTIAANALVIGSRNIMVDGITFEANAPAINRASWSAGNIGYVGDDGNVFTRAIPAGSTAAYAGSTIFIHWVKDSTTLQATTSQAVAFDSNSVVIATYKGGIALDQNYGRTIIEGSTIKTGSIQTLQIAAKAIKADQIDGGAINATHIEANAIKAAAIDTDAILARHIKAGEITTEHLTVGSTGNLLKSSDFSANGDFWGAFVPTGTSLIVTNNWAPGEPTWELRGNGQMQVYTDARIVPGQRYQASDYVNCHRCRVTLYLQFLNASGTVVGGGNVSTAAMGADPAGTNLGAFKRLSVFATAPASARVARLLFSKEVNDPGQTDSYGWHVRPFLGEALPNQTEPSPWSPAGITQISGGMIMTDAISARQISTRSIDTNRLTLNGIEIDNINFGATTVVASGSGNTSRSNLGGQGGQQYQLCRVWINMAVAGTLICWHTGSCGARGTTSGNDDYFSASAGFKTDIDGIQGDVRNVGAGDHYIDLWGTTGGSPTMAAWNGKLFVVGAKKT